MLICINQTNAMYLNLLLRIGIAGTFLGHGIYALTVRPDWLIFLEYIGFSSHEAQQLMPIIGLVDIFVALMVLFFPIRIILLYASVWAFSAALMRPLVGMSILEFVERSANWVLPLTLLIINGFPKTFADLFFIQSLGKDVSTSGIVEFIKVKQVN
jgi:hypothetical protein